MKTVILFLSLTLMLLSVFFYQDHLDKMKKEEEIDSLKIQNKNLQSVLASLSTNLEIQEIILNDIERKEKEIKHKMLIISDDEYIRDTSKIYKYPPFKYKLLDLIPKTEYLAKRIKLQSNVRDTLLKAMNDNYTFLKCVPIIKPVSTEYLYSISSDFGLRIDPKDSAISFHEGIDLATEDNAPVKATGDGYVIKIVYSPYGYGNKIIINHGYGYKTIYAHLDKICTKKGKYVKRGDVIGTVGSSGKSTGTHLHYEVLKSNKNVNPGNHVFTYKTKYTKPFEYLLLLPN